MDPDFYAAKDLKIISRNVFCRHNNHYNIRAGKFFPEPGVLSAKVLSSRQQFLNYFGKCFLPLQQQQQ